MRALLVLALLLAAAPPAAAKPGPVLVEAATTEATVKPQAVAMFPVNLTNRGGAPVRVEVDLALSPKNLVVPLPHPLVVDAGKTSSFSIAAQSPYHNGRIDEAESFQVRVTPVDPDRPQEKGEPTTLTFRVHTVGVYVPGPGVALALVAVALAGRIWRES